MRLLIRFARQFARQSNYKKSNQVIETDFYISHEAKSLAASLLATHDTDARQDLSQKLLDELNKLSEIAAVQVKISDTLQKSKRRNGRLVFKQYGYYKPAAKYIYITNRTAVRAKLLAPKTFLNTLLHEWMHHYDGEKLGLRSIHSAGFYARIKNVKEKLVFLTPPSVRAGQARICV